nr:AMP-binding protein [Actinomyces lilanjuaniae]
MFPGYWQDPQETAEVLTKDGWLRTGDLVREEEGFYVIADRRKELIISGGFNVYPSEVEEAVRSMPQVEDVAVVGLPGEAGGESVVAAILPKEGQNVTLEQVRDWAARTLSHYALPRQVAILSEMPRSQIGKILRRAVREELLAAREAASVAATAAVTSVKGHLAGGTGQTGDGPAYQGGTEPGHRDDQRPGKDSTPA